MVIDTQSVRAPAGVPKTTTGRDANKRTPGRKRGLAVDVLGLIAGGVAMGASAHDDAAGTALRDQIEHLTATLAETEAHLTELATTRKIIAKLAQTGVDPSPHPTRTRPPPETDLPPS
ncbi:hypothetical protein [Streptomyces sp. NBC_00775]|uniref:hypothetical protein n=1 Tax=Streptomyces sp. NBC_00775 TaxID=2975828 RepID=UPI003FA6D4D9